MQEKADKIIEEEEELFKAHMCYLKEDAQLLTEEGELINNLQSNFKIILDVSSDDYDIDDYINKMETVVKKKPTT